MDMCPLPVESSVAETMAQDMDPTDSQLAGRASLGKRDRAGKALTSCHRRRSAGFPIAGVEPLIYIANQSITVEI